MTSSNYRSAIASWSLATLIALAAVAAGATYYGSFQAFISAMNGADVIVGQTTINLGTLNSGESTSIKIDVTNLSSRPVNLLGAKVDCTCISLPDLPCSLPGRQRVQLPVHVDCVGSGPKRHVVSLFTDCDAQNTLVFSISFVVRS